MANRPVENADGTYTATTYVTGPRWAGLENFLWESALNYGLKYKTLSKSGLIRQTVWFEITGDMGTIKRFVDVLIETLSEY